MLTKDPELKPRQRWSAKCGIALPILYVSCSLCMHTDPLKYCRTILTTGYRSVHDRHGSPKKREWVFNPFTRQRIPIQRTKPKHLNLTSDRVKMRALFDAALVDTTKIIKYNAAHAGLLQLEKKSAWDRDAIPKANSTDKSVQQERDAASIIRTIREYERKAVFGNQASEDIPGKDTRDMGGQFLTNKERIDCQSLLFQIALKVPKGGLLHLHFNAELHPEQLLVKAREIENMYVWSARAILTRQDLDETEMVFNVLDKEKVDKGVNIFSDTYAGTGNNWKDEELKWKVHMPWTQFQTKFKEKFTEMVGQTPKTPITAGSTCCAGPAEPGSAIALTPAEKWLKSKMVLSEEEAYRSTQTVNG
jgi:adenosine deaminase CECR1